MIANIEETSDPLEASRIIIERIHGGNPAGISFLDKFSQKELFDSKKLGRSLKTEGQSQKGFEQRA